MWGIGVRHLWWLAMQTSVWLAAGMVSLFLGLVLLPYLRNLGKKLPPGPPSWPMLGSLMYLGGELHQVLWELSKKHGPVMRVGLGQHTLIVVSTAEVAEEVMKKRDVEFAHRAGRTIQRSAAKYVGFDSNDIAFADYSPQLRLLRKLCTTELFTNSRLVASAKIRTKEVDVLVNTVRSLAEKGEMVTLRGYLHSMTMNNICQMLFGKRYYGDDIPVTLERQNFKKVVNDVFENVGRLNLADLIPALRWFDLQGIEADWKRIRPQSQDILSLIIEEHRVSSATAECTGDSDSRDFVDVLLGVQGKDKLSESAMIGLLFDMILGGTDTTATTIEWTMVEVVRHPAMMRRLQEELDTVVGSQRRVEESDLPNLPFLQAFVKEIFRLHIPVPITLPRLNEKASTVGGYDIPAGCTLFVNTYAIAHDPKNWEDPMVFDPDRFLGSTTTLAGTHYELLPFGSGRRKCVGIQLGINTVSRALAALVHAFDWAPPPGVEPLDIDISEHYCVVVRNQIPLRARATPRGPVTAYLGISPT